MIMIYIDHAIRVKRVKTQEAAAVLCQPQRGPCRRRQAVHLTAAKCPPLIAGHAAILSARLLCDDLAVVGSALACRRAKSLTVSGIPATAPSADLLMSQCHQPSSLARTSVTERPFAGAVRAGGTAGFGGAALASPASS